MWSEVPESKALGARSVPRPSLGLGDHLSQRLRAGLTPGPVRVSLLALSAPGPAPNPECWLVGDGVPGNFRVLGTPHQLLEKFRRFSLVVIML